MGILDAAGAVVKPMVALYEEAVEAALPAVARFVLLPGGYVVLDCAPGDADVLTQLYSALAAQAPPLSVSARGQPCVFPGECPTEVVKVASAAMNGREASNGPFSEFAGTEIVVGITEVVKLDAAVPPPLDRDIEPKLAAAAHPVCLQPPPQLSPLMHGQEPTELLFANKCLRKRWRDIERRFVEKAPKRPRDTPQAAQGDRILAKTTEDKKK